MAHLWLTEGLDPRDSSAEVSTCDVTTRAVLVCRPPLTWCEHCRFLANHSGSEQGERFRTLLEYHAAASLETRCQEETRRLEASLGFDVDSAAV